MLMTMNDFSGYRQDYAGYCVFCREMKAHALVEPDCDDATCDICERPSVLSIEQAANYGHITIDD